MEKQRNNSYLGAAEKREKAHSHTEKKLPQRRGRRRAKAHRDWSGEELRKVKAHREGEGAVSLSKFHWVYDYFRFLGFMSL